MQTKTGNLYVKKSQLTDTAHSYLEGAIIVGMRQGWFAHAQQGGFVHAPIAIIMMCHSS